MCDPAGRATALTRPEMRRRAGLGLLFVVAVAAWWGIFPPPPSAFSQSGAHGSATSSESLQVLSALLPNGTQQIVVVDPRARTMAVYHIDPAQAKVQLRSVRNLSWDLQMEHFNGQPPLPGDLRKAQPQ